MYFLFPYLCTIIANDSYKYVLQSYSIISKNQRKTMVKYDYKSQHLSWFSNAIRDASQELCKNDYFLSGNITMKKYHYCIALGISITWLEKLLKRTKLRIDENGQIAESAD